MTNQWRKPFDNDVLCEAIGIPVDITAAWLASLSSGWSADAWSHTIDFSPYVPVGTKMVLIHGNHYANTGANNIYLYARRYGDEEVSATPNASGEFGCLIAGTLGTGFGSVFSAWVPLSIDGRIQLAVSVVPVQPVTNISYPEAYVL